MRSLRVWISAALLPVLFGAGMVSEAAARMGVLELDPSATVIEFKLGGALHSTHGKFRLKRGSITANDTTSDAEGEIVVDAASGESGDFLRDRRMRDSILDTSKWSDITLSPRHFSGQLDARGTFSGRLLGVLTLHGASHEIAIEAHGTLKDDRVTAFGHFTIPYVEWGMKDPSMLFLKVDKVVDIDITTTGRVRWTNSP